MTFLDLLNRPAGVFGDQRFGISRGFLQMGQGGFIPRVSQSDANIS